MQKPAEFALGEASVQPNQPLPAGSYTTIEYTFTAGHPIDDSGYIKFAFRSVTDIGTPQFDDPPAPNYCTVHTSGDCRIEPRWDPKGHTRPWSKALFLKIRGGFLNEGEKITLLFGDTSGGSPGWQLQTFCQERFEFKTLVDPIATYQFKELPTSPSLSIVAGEPARAICIAPSQVMVAKAFPFHIKLEDKWGNPTEEPVEITHPGYPFTGVETISALVEETGLSARSNPIQVLEEAPHSRHFWADFHGQTGETVGSGSIEDYFRFARDFALLDIVGHQGNDFQISDAFWEKINRVTKDYYEPGAFLTFPGYEWSGNTPLGGDRNVFFVSEGGAITRSCSDLIPDDHTTQENSPTADAMFERLKEQPGPQPFAFAHVGGRYADLRMHDAEIELAVEVHSAWGTFEWLVEEALGRGYRMGICANSDGHKGRPGASYPGAGDFGSYGGLTCVLAKRLDRESVYHALASRHFYATTGNRSLIDLAVSTGDGRTAMMGDVVELIPNQGSVPSLSVNVVGTAGVESVEVRNGLEVIETLRPYGVEELGKRIKIVWSGAKVRGRDRMVRWDGRLWVRGNAIRDALPINFWNPNKRFEVLGDDQVVWESSTTGGTSGMILSLEEPLAGKLEIETIEGDLDSEISALSLEPRTWEFGGLRKKIDAYRLPDQPPTEEFSFTLPLTGLPPGDNPIYIHMTQEDGHMAWSSPVYLVVE
jgi:hypothetical protein